MAKRGSNVGQGGQTMQLDALVDSLEEIAPAPGGVSLPPPLPPKKTSPLAYVLMAVVVVAMAGAGIGVGMMVMGSPEPAPAATAEPEAPAPPEAEPEATEEPAAAADGDPTDEAAGDIVQMDEILFDN